MSSTIGRVWRVSFVDGSVAHLSGYELEGIDPDTITALRYVGVMPRLKPDEDRDEPPVFNFRRGAEHIRVADLCHRCRNLVPCDPDLESLKSDPLRYRCSVPSSSLTMARVCGECKFFEDRNP